MRDYLLGQLLMGGGWITGKQYSTAVDYASAKGMSIGAVFKLLKYLSEEQVEEAILVQSMVKEGLCKEIAQETLKLSAQRGISVREAFTELTKKAFAAESFANAGAASSRVDKSVDQSAATSLSSASGADSKIDSLKAGEALCRDGRYKEAEESFTAHIKECEEKHGKSSLQYAEALARLASVYMATGRLLPAEDLYLKILDIRRSCLGTDDPLVDQSIEDLSDLYMALKDSDRALQFFKLAVVNRERRLPADIETFVTLLKKIHPFFLTFSDKMDLRQTGQMVLQLGLISQQGLDAAAKNARKSDLPLGLELAKDGQIGGDVFASLMSLQDMIRQKRISQFVGDSCMKAALCLGRNLEQFLNEVGFFDGSEEPSAEGLAIIELNEQLLAAELELGPKHPQVARIIFALAEKYESRQSDINAEFLYKRALIIWRDALEDGDVELAFNCSRRLARRYMSTSRFAEAELPLMQCLSLNQRLNKSADADFEALISLACLKHSQGDDMASGFLLRSALSVLEKVSEPTFISVEDIAWMMECLDSQGLSAESRRLADAQHKLRVQKNLVLEEKWSTLLRSPV